MGVAGKIRSKNGCCLAAPAPEFFTEFFAVVRAVHVKAFFILRHFADDFSICFDLDFIPFHVLTSGHIVCPISDMRYALKKVSVIR